VVARNERRASLQYALAIHLILESRNTSLYVRHGFKIVDTIQGAIERHNDDEARCDRCRGRYRRTVKKYCRQYHRGGYRRSLSCDETVRTGKVHGEGDREKHHGPIQEWHLDLPVFFR
jgi:hypothetical protein